MVIRYARWTNVKSGILVILLAWATTLMANVAAPETAALADPREVRLGVMAFRSVGQTEKQWSPLADYLSSKVPHTRFKVIPLQLDNVENNVRAGWIDFVLLNPEQYVTLASRYQMAAIATLMPKTGEQPVSRFGGVIFTRSERKDIDTLSDFTGRRIAAVSDKSFAGYLAQKWMLAKNGFNLERDAIVVTTGLPQDKAVTAVLEGRADIGFVRTGVLESMQREGRIAAGQLKVIGGRKEPDFPLQLSTELYPEWPMAVMSHVGADLSKQVALALLHLEPTHPAAQQSEVYGFAPPGDYPSISALILRLREHPDRLELFGIAEVIQKYVVETLLGALAIVALALLGVLTLRRRNRQLAGVIAESRRLAQREELLDSLSEGVYGVDFDGRCTFINDTALTLLGYRAEEIIGQDQHAIFHHHYPDGRPYPHEACPLRMTLNDGQRRECEETFFNKSGEGFPVRFAARAMLRDGRVSGAVVAFQDIRREKEAAQRIHDMAMQDSLTGLPNRRSLWDRLEVELIRAVREKTQLAVLFVDLDGFKAINDTLGHETGDVFLQTVASRLREQVRAVDVVARLGGDEFVVVLTSVRDGADVARVATKIIESVAKFIEAPGRGGGYLTVSIGIAQFPAYGTDANALVHNADLAMYEAKAAGKNRYAFFSSGVE